MKLLLATIAIASLSLAAGAQTTTPAAKPGAKPSASTAPAKPVSRREAIEVSTPLEENDPADKLTAAELEIAKRVHVGEIKC